MDTGIIVSPVKLYYHAHTDMYKEKKYLLYPGCFFPCMQTPDAWGIWCQGTIVRRIGSWIMEHMKFICTSIQAEKPTLPSSICKRVDGTATITDGNNKHYI